MENGTDGFVAEISIGVFLLIVIVILIVAGLGWVSKNVSVKVNSGPPVSVPDLIDDDGTILVQTIDGSFIRVRIK